MNVQTPSVHTSAANTIRDVMTEAQVLRRGGLGWRRPARPVPGGGRRHPKLRRFSGRLFGTTQGLPPVVASMLVLMAVLMSVLIDQWPSVVPWMSFVPLVVIAGLFLPPRWLAVVLVVIFGLFAHEGWLLGMDKPSFAGAFVVSFIVAGMMVWLSVSRARLGVHGIAGESILVDLRDRLRAHGELPTLPEPWHAEAALSRSRVTSSWPPARAPATASRSPWWTSRARASMPAHEPCSSPGRWADCWAPSTQRTSLARPTPICFARSGARDLPPRSTWPSSSTPDGSALARPDTLRRSSSRPVRAGGRCWTLKQVHCSASWTAQPFPCLLYTSDAAD